MKVKVSSLLASMSAVFLMSFAAQAQEELPILETQIPSHRELNLDEDKILLYDQSIHSGTVKDSIPAPARTVPAHPLKISKPDSHKNTVKEREGEDALSFNFLYYMFQKFKMSDLVDQ